MIKRFWNWLVQKRCKVCGGKIGDENWVLYPNDPYNPEARYIRCKACK